MYVVTIEYSLYTRTPSRAAIGPVRNRIRDAVGFLRASSLSHTSQGLARRAWDVGAEQSAEARKT